MAYISDLTQVYLNKLGVSSHDVLSFVLSNENNPSLIYSTAKQYGITTQMLAEVVSSAIPSIDVSGVRQFFKNSGLDSLQLDNSSAHLDPNYFKNLFDSSKLVQYQGINDDINLGDGADRLGEAVFELFEETEHGVAEGDPGFLLRRGCRLCGRRGRAGPSGGRGCR